MPTASPLVITGMHRCGTSLTAALLREAGLAIGERLLDLGGDRRLGHSEDLDVVELHQLVLADNGLSTAGWTVESEIRWSEPHVLQARALVDGHAGRRTWGWKDPRTVLVLPFWQALLPDAAFLFLYRSPWAVADSLFRRGDFTFFWRPTLAVEIWLHYNRLLLDFMDRHPERCLLMAADRVVADPAGAVSAVSRRFELDLVDPTEDIVDRALFAPDTPEPERAWAVEQLFPEVLDVYDHLGRAAGSHGHAGDRPSTVAPRDGDPLAVFERWVAASRLAGQRPPNGARRSVGSGR
jgi:hypothetical protein